MSYERCEKCGDEVTSGPQYDTDAREEAIELFGELAKWEPLAVICSRCSLEFREWFDRLTPEERKEIERNM